MRVGVYVGSFNPPHNGHKKIIDHLLENNYVDKVMIIPTLNYWSKQDLLDIKVRSDMLKFYENQQIKVMENLSKYQYTYEILEYLNANYNDEFYLIMGADNIGDFDKWKNVNSILKNQILIIPRDEINVHFLLSKYENKDKFILVNDFKSLNISSTFIRENIQNGNIEKVKDFMDCNVLDYIIKNNLYKGV